MGTAAFAVPALQRLKAAGHDIALVICQPDRPKGRGQQLQGSAREGGGAAGIGAGGFPAAEGQRGRGAVERIVGRQAGAALRGGLRADPA